MILPKHATFCIFIFMSASRSMNHIILYDLSFIMIFNFIAINHIISGTQPHLLIWTFLSKVQPQGVSFCLFFLTGVTYKMFPIKKPVSHICRFGIKVQMIRKCLGNIYLFKVNNKNTTKSCTIFWKLLTKTTERRCHYC